MLSVYVVPGLNHGSPATSGCNNECAPASASRKLPDVVLLLSIRLKSFEQLEVGVRSDPYMLGNVVIVGKDVRVIDGKIRVGETTLVGRVTETPERLQLAAMQKASVEPGRTRHWLPVPLGSGNRERDLEYRSSYRPSMSMHCLPGPSSVRCRRRTDRWDGSVAPKPEP